MGKFSPSVNVSDVLEEGDYATSMANGEQVVETLKSRLKPTSFWARVLIPLTLIVGLARTAISSV